jgi:large subunit ribosomal protein L4
MRVSVRNMEGQVVGALTLSEEVFGMQPHEAAMHQAVVRQLANARLGTAASKTRGEVAGGGAKPYRQKGTGRARQGTTRAPQFRGGGVVFGPHPRSYAQDIPRKMRRLALRSALSTKAAEENLIVIDRLEFATPSTKAMIGVLKSLGVERSALVVLPETNDTVYRSARNIPRVKTLPVENLNIVDLLNHTTLLLPVAAVRRIEGHFGVAPQDVEPAEAGQAEPRDTSAEKGTLEVAEKTVMEE